MNTASLGQPARQLTAAAPHSATLEQAGFSYLATPDGHAIPVRHWPVANPRAVVHIAHGMSEHSGCYADVAPYLNQAGYAVVAHDHRCHGHSVAQEQLGNVGATQHWQGIADDMGRINAHIRSLYPNTRIALLGHSMGSFISLGYAQAHSEDIDVLLLEGSNHEAPWFIRAARLIAVFEGWRQGPEGRSKLIHLLSFGGFNNKIRNARTECDWISRDPVFVDRYINDPRCGFQCSNGYWKDFLGGLAGIYQIDNIRRIRASLPIYVFAGDQDQVGHCGRGVKALHGHLQKVVGKLCTMVLYPGARHDILHETNRDEVISNMIAWLDQQLPPV